MIKLRQVFAKLENTESKHMSSILLALCTMPDTRLIPMVFLKMVSLENDFIFYLTVEGILGKELGKEIRAPSDWC